MLRSMIKARHTLYDDEEWRISTSLSITFGRCSNDWVDLAARRAVAVATMYAIVYMYQSKVTLDTACIRNHHERTGYLFDLVSRNDLYVHISYRRSRLPTSHEGDHEHSLSIKLYETHWQRWHCWQ